MMCCFTHSTSLCRNPQVEKGAKQKAKQKAKAQGGGGVEAAAAAEAPRQVRVGGRAAGLHLPVCFADDVDASWTGRALSDIWHSQTFHHTSLPFSDPQWNELYWPAFPLYFFASLEHCSMLTPFFTRSGTTTTCTLSSRSPRSCRRRCCSSSTPSEGGGGGGGTGWGSVEAQIARRLCHVTRHFCPAHAGWASAQSAAVLYLLILHPSAHPPTLPLSCPALTRTHISHCPCAQLQVPRARRLRHEEHEHRHRHGQPRGHCGAQWRG